MSLSHSPRIVTNGLIGYWDAGNTRSYSGSGTSWSDLSGNNYDGTLTNSPTYSNGSLVFNGLNQYVNFGNVSGLNFNYTNSFTLAAWFKRSSTLSGVQNIVSKQLITSPYTGYQLAFNSRAAQSTGNLGITAIGNHPTNSLGVETTAGFNTTNWYYGVATYNGSGSNSGILIYVNGSAQPTTGFYVGTTTVSFSNSVSFEIGARDGASTPFPGNISNVQVYNRALSPQEVKQNFNALRGRFSL